MAKTEELFDGNVYEERPDRQDKGLFQLPGAITKITSMARRTLRFQVDSNENLTDEQMANAMSLVEKFGWFTFSVDSMIVPHDLLSLPPLPKQDDGKSPGQRLRAVLWVYWNGKKPTDTFELFYHQQMDRIIEFIKEKLP